ncbi:MAG: aspartate aminotransferase family protein [Solirubrobacterales bacterium]|nr:aspartate aminotransferase family protein [Solirubrobacterales bacterium]
MSLERLQGLERSAVMPTYKRLPVEFVRGEGALLWDDEGREYLDLLAGIAVDNAGHCHPDVVAAVTGQVSKLIHVSNLFYTQPGMELASRLSESSLGGLVFLCNSGAEANEAAIKLARRHKPGGNFVVLEGAFHGRTMGALSATPQPEKQAPFAPLVPGFSAVCADVTAITAAVNDETAAVLIEPIQGEGGIYPVPDDVLVAAREACDRHGALLIFDEVQTGAGRTGSLWAYQQTSVVPDAMTIAKGVGAGFPVGALITSASCPTSLVAGDHGSTFAGGPVTAAAALASLGVVAAEDLLTNVKVLGAKLMDGLAQLPGVERVRGRGLMIGADISGDAPAVVLAALQQEALVINATGPSTLRFVPPLVITKAQIDAALERLSRLPLA